jgi:protein CpxP
MSDKDTSPNNGRSRFVNRKIIALVTGTAIAIGGIFGVQAFTNTKAYAYMKLYTVDYGGWRHGRFSSMSDVEIEAQIERVVKHVAIEIDATPEQQEKITALVSAVAKDLKPMRERMMTTWQEVHGLLLHDTIDRDALERLRAQRLAEADEISKNLVGAVADVAEVLTAEQRRVLEKRIKQFRSHRRGWKHG